MLECHLDSIAELILDNQKLSQFKLDKATYLKQHSHAQVLTNIDVDKVEVFKQIIIGTRSMRYYQFLSVNIPMSDFDGIVKDYSDSQVVNAKNDLDIPQFINFLMQYKIFPEDMILEFISSGFSQSPHLMSHVSGCSLVDKYFDKKLIRPVLKIKTPEAFHILFQHNNEIQLLEVDEESFNNFSSHSNVYSSEIDDFLSEWELI